jgi:hypothetical protein
MQGGLNPGASAAQRALRCAGEIVPVFLVFAIYAAWPAPDSGESHYLAKAKHFWNPAWCPGDFFWLFRF